MSIINCAPDCNLPSSEPEPPDRRILINLPHPPIDQPPTPASLPLVPQHLDDFHKSGIPDTLIALADIKTVTRGEAQKLLNIDEVESRPVGYLDPEDALQWGWMVPFGEGYWRGKPDHPRETTSGKTVKYESPRGVPNRVYFPPGFDRAKGKTIYITEGEKKSLSAMAHGLNCLGLTGVDNWQRARPKDDRGRGYGPRHLIDDLAEIHWAGRDVVIIYDSDVADKREVASAEARLAEMLTKHGAKVRAARLPAGPGGVKQGLDDAIVALGIDKVQEIIDNAVTPDLPKLDHAGVARMFVAEAMSFNDVATLRYWRQDFYKWNSRHHEKQSDDAIRSDVYHYLDKVGWPLKMQQVSEVIASLKADLLIDDKLEPPAYLDGECPTPGFTSLIFKNRVLCLDFSDPNWRDSAYTPKHTANLFALGSRDFDFDPDACCPGWHNFLGSIMDQDSMDLLGEWFGYVLSGDMSRQSFMVFTGATRGGKGVITTILTDLVGADLTVSSTLKSLASTHGTSLLVGKRSLLLPDAHDRGDQISSVDVIKNITGNDPILINPKNKSLYTTQLMTRITMSCNAMPRWLDPSCALLARMLLINFTESFAGCEDKELTAKLREERAGIFNWAMQGFDRLQAQKKFTMPRDSRAVLAETADAMSPVRRFLAECTEDTRRQYVPVQWVWRAWQAWAVERNLAVGSDSKLGTEIRAVMPGVKKGNRRVNLITANPGPANTGPANPVPATPVQMQCYIDMVLSAEGQRCRAAFEEHDGKGRRIGR